MNKTAYRFIRFCDLMTKNDVGFWEKREEAGRKARVFLSLRIGIKEPSHCQCARAFRVAKGHRRVSLVDVLYYSRGALKKNEAIK